MQLIAIDLFPSQIDEAVAKSTNLDFSEFWMSHVQSAFK
jgi:hypothetical protein